MSDDVRDILEALDEYEQTPESRGIELRLDLAEIVIRHLRLKGWTQRDFAEKTGYKESFISRILHSNANCTLDTVGRLLFALGVNVRIEEATPASPLYLGVVSTSGKRRRISQQDIANAQSTVKVTQTSASESSFQLQESYASGP